MKIGFVTLVFLLAIGVAQAGDVSCQVDLLKPKLKASVIEDESSKPASMTVAEARIRLLNHRNTEKAAETNQESVHAEESDLEADTEKEESGLGGIFDILLPSKLRNPVK